MLKKAVFISGISTILKTAFKLPKKALPASFSIKKSPKQLKIIVENRSAFTLFLTT